MIVDIVDKLIDRCIQLVRYKKEVSKSLFNDYVQPIQSDLEAVHRDYLDTFRKYREMIKAPKPPLNPRHPVLDSIKSDAVFNAQLRMKIHGVMAAASDPLLGDFIKSIWNYFYSVAERTESLLRDEPRRYEAEDPKENHRIDYDSFDPIDPPDNQGRSVAYDYLEDIFRSAEPDEIKRDFAIEVIDSIVSVLQTNYANEIREYSRLKSVLVTPQ